MTTASRAAPPTLTDVAELPATTCAFVTACCDPTKNPLPTGGPDRSRAVTFAVLASADAASALTSECRAGRLGRPARLEAGEGRAAPSPPAVPGSGRQPRRAGGGAFGRDPDRDRLARRKAEGGGDARHHQRGQQPDEQHDVGDAHHGPTRHVERPQRLSRTRRLIIAPAAAPTVSPIATNATTPRSATSARRLPDLEQLLVEQRGGDEHERESAERTGEPEHRAKEARARAGDQAEREQDEDERVQEVHGRRQAAAGDR